MMFLLSCLVAFLIFFVPSNLEATAENGKFKRSYVCPPNFLRLSHKCYHFSNTTATFQDAYWRCRELHGNIVTIKNPHQDKLVRKLLIKDRTKRWERWIGGRYDWGLKSWIWAASGNPVQYQGFSDVDLQLHKESFMWQCIVLDPIKQYRWSARSCVARRHFICQTKLRTVNSGKDKLKLQKQFHADKYNKLNEVPIPDISSNVLPNVEHYYKKNYISNNEVDNLAYSQKYDPQTLRSNNPGTKMKRDFIRRNVNGTLLMISGSKGKGMKRNKRRKQQEVLKKSSMKDIKYRTYFEPKKSPLHPRGIVEEFNFR